MYNLTPRDKETLNLPQEKKKREVTCEISTFNIWVERIIIQKKKKKKEPWNQASETRRIQRLLVARDVDVPLS